MNYPKRIEIAPGLVWVRGNDEYDGIPTSNGTLLNATGDEITTEGCDQETAENLKRELAPVIGPHEVFFTDKPNHKQALETTKKWLSDAHTNPPFVQESVNLARCYEENACLFLAEVKRTHDLQQALKNILACVGDETYHGGEKVGKRRAASLNTSILKAKALLWVLERSAK